MKVAQSCLTLGDPVDYTVPGILQATVFVCLPWASVPLSVKLDGCSLLPVVPLRTLILQNADSFDAKPIEPERQSVAVQVGQGACVPPRTPT